jgi:uncharacterized OsmC-like protein
MSNEQIRQSIGQVAKHFADHPEDAVSQDRPAVATLEGGLRCRVVGPRGAVLVSDMPAALGGEGSEPTPGWFLRGALASCDATVIAMRAAQLGITLTKLEVTVGSQSDTRGLLGVADPVPAGPLDVQVSVRIASADASAAQLHELVRWAESHSPVGDAVRRAIPLGMQVIVE